MKILNELSIILGILLVSDIIQKLTNMPIPATVLGMVILLLCLITGIVKLENIENISDFFMKHLTFLFVPSCVGVLSSWGLIKDKWILLFLIIFITTIVGIVTTGLSVQIVKGKKQGRR